jgi:hypothetical protein
VRGYSANVLLTEFAFFENPDQTWRAILPAVTNPLRGGIKKVRLITTPNGIGNKACDIWSKNYSPQRWGETPRNELRLPLDAQTSNPNISKTSQGSTERVGRGGSTLVSHPS